MAIGIDGMFGDGGSEDARGSKGDVGGKGNIGSAALVGIGGEALARSKGSIVIPLICTACSVRL